MWGAGGGVEIAGGCGLGVLVVGERGLGQGLSAFLGMFDCALIALIALSEH
jgi:hypothetical protein